MPHSRTGARAPLAGNRAATPTKDVEAALDAHIRDAGLSFDRLGLQCPFCRGDLPGGAS